MKGIILCFLLLPSASLSLWVLLPGEGGSNLTTLTFLCNIFSLPILVLILFAKGVYSNVSKMKMVSLAVLGSIGNIITILGIPSPPVRISKMQV